MFSFCLSLVFFLFFSETKSQSSCAWYNWTSTDWPDGKTQNFSTLLGNAYLDSSDFESGGSFYGSTWEKVLYSNVNYYRPLGFRYAQLGALNKPTVCLNATGTKGYKVELMIYTLTSGSSICVKDMTEDDFDMSDTGALTDCASQYLYKCFAADTSDNFLKVAVYCSTNCLDSSSVDLLYRFRRSDSTYYNYTANNPEMWCMTIASSIDYPDSIGSSTPNNYVNQNSNLFGSSSTISCTIALFIAMIFTFFNY